MQNEDAIRNQETRSTCNRNVQVSVAVNSTSASPSDAQWYVTLQNVALWMNKPLNYELRVSCNAAYACPAPLLRANGQPGPQCSGHGTCAAPTPAFLAAAHADGDRGAAGNDDASSVSANNRADSAASVGSAAGAAGATSGGGGGGVALAATQPVPVPPRVCTCRTGYGDVGCNVPVTPLGRGQVASRVHVPIGGWSYFSLDVRPLLHPHVRHKTRHDFCFSLPVAMRSCSAMTAEVTCSHSGLPFPELLMFVVCSCRSGRRTCWWR